MIFISAYLSPQHENIPDKNFIHRLPQKTQTLKSMKNPQIHCYYVQPGQRITYPKDMIPYTPPVWKYSTQFLLQFKSLCMRNIYCINIEMASTRTKSRQVNNNKPENTVTQPQNVVWRIQEHDDRTNDNSSPDTNSSLDIPDPPSMFSSIDPGKTSKDMEVSLPANDSAVLQDDDQSEAKMVVDQIDEISIPATPSTQEQHLLQLNVDAASFTPQPPVNQPFVSKLCHISKQFPQGRDPKKSIWDRR